MPWIHFSTAFGNDDFHDVSPWLSIGIIFVIPALLVLCALQLVAVVCVRRKRIGQGSWMTLGMEEFVQCTQRILLDEELEELLDIEDEMEGVEKPRVRRP